MVDNIQITDIIESYESNQPSDLGVSRNITSRFKSNSVPVTPSQAYTEVMKMQNKTFLEMLQVSGDQNFYCNKYALITTSLKSRPSFKASIRNNESFK